MAYLSLSTASLPDPVIDPALGASPADYFDIDTYTGTGATQERSNFTFQPDWLWIKRRSTADNHTSWDSMRGVNKVLKPNETGAEGTDATQISSFDADGFTLLSGGDVNASGQTFVAWCWKANGSGVTNTDGSITSTVSANTTSGFSIVSYTGNNSNSTIGHGLSSAPDMIIAKSRSGAFGWGVYHSSVGYTKYLTLETTGAATTGAVWGTAAPTTSVFSISPGTLVNQSGGNYIAYCFHSVDGFSKMGSYTGNGSANGPFVYTGFRPSFVIIKNANFAEIWPMFDDKRDADNQVENPVYANLSSAEGTASSRGLDFLSNGFKIRGTDTSVNRSGDTHIYMAFAESPFKYSVAR